MDTPESAKRFSIIIFKSTRVRVCMRLREESASQCNTMLAHILAHNAMASSLKGERCSRGDSIIAFFLIIAQRKEIQRQKHFFYICSAIATKLFVTRCRCIPPFLVSKWKLFQNNHWVSSDRNGNFKSLKILRRRSQPGIASCEVVKFSD